jgi:hypothetical protein
VLAGVIPLDRHGWLSSHYLVIPVPDTDHVVAEIHQRISQEVPIEVPAPVRPLGVIPISRAIIDALFVFVLKPPHRVELLPGRLPGASPTLDSFNDVELISLYFLASLFRAAFCRNSTNRPSASSFTSMESSRASVARVSGPAALVLGEHRETIHKSDTKAGARCQRCEGSPFQRKIHAPLHVGRARELHPRTHARNRQPEDC